MKDKTCPQCLRPITRGKDGMKRNGRMQLVAVKPVGKLGRVIVPHEVRKAWGFEPGAEIGIFIIDGRIVLEPLDEGDRCALCRQPAKKTVSGRRICDDCIMEVSKARRLYRR